MSRAADRKRHWARIPEGLDILVTHGPSLGILDYSASHGFFLVNFNA